MTYHGNRLIRDPTMREIFASEDDRYVKVEGQTLNAGINYRPVKGKVESFTPKEEAIETLTGLARTIYLAKVKD